MKYTAGLLILLIGIYAITDLAIKTRYTRKRLKNIKNIKHNKDINMNN